MPYKICPHCNRESYSASGREEWICPTCQKDISHIEFKDFIPVSRRIELVKKVPKNIIVNEVQNK